MAKANKKQGLGRGLSALLNDQRTQAAHDLDQQPQAIAGQIVHLDINLIQTNPFQPRTYFNETGLKELAVSIKELGVIQPITVRQTTDNAFQLVSGERRYRASKLINLKHIPAYIRTANDQELLEMALVENIQRQDLDPIEIALSYQRLIEEINLTQEALSDRVGKNRSTVTNYLRLLKLDPIIQTGMRDGFLSMGHGRALLGVSSPEAQLSIYQKIIQLELSVRATEDLVRNLHDANAASKKSKSVRALNYAAEQDSLKAYLSSSVKISSKPNGSGQILISFKTKEELDNLLKRIKSEE